MDELIDTILVLKQDPNDVCANKRLTDLIKDRTLFAILINFFLDPNFNADKYLYTSIIGFTTNYIHSNFKDLTPEEKSMFFSLVKQPLFVLNKHNLICECINQEFNKCDVYEMYIEDIFGQISRSLVEENIDLLICHVNIMYTIVRKFNVQRQNHMINLHDIFLRLINIMNSFKSYNFIILSHKSNILYRNIISSCFLIVNIYKLDFSVFDDLFSFIDGIYEKLNGATQEVHMFDSSRLTVFFGFNIYLLKGILIIFQLFAKIVKASDIHLMSNRITGILLVLIDYRDIPLDIMDYVLKIYNLYKDVHDLSRNEKLFNYLLNHFELKNRDICDFDDNPGIFISHFFQKNGKSDCQQILESFIASNNDRLRFFLESGFNEITLRIMGHIIDILIQKIPNEFIQWFSTLVNTDFSDKILLQCCRFFVIKKYLDYVNTNADYINDDLCNLLLHNIHNYFDIHPVLTVIVCKICNSLVKFDYCPSEKLFKSLMKILTISSNEYVRSHAIQTIKNITCDQDNCISYSEEIVIYINKQICNEHLSEKELDAMIDILVNIVDSSYYIVFQHFNIDKLEHILEHGDDSTIEAVIKLYENVIDFRSDVIPYNYIFEVDIHFTSVLLYSFCDNSSVQEYICDSKKTILNLIIKYPNELESLYDTLNDVLLNIIDKNDEFVGPCYDIYVFYHLFNRNVPFNKDIMAITMSLIENIEERKDFEVVACTNFMMSYYLSRGEVPQQNELDLIIFMLSKKYMIRKFDVDLAIAYFRFLANKNIVSSNITMTMNMLINYENDDIKDSLSNEILLWDEPPEIDFQKLLTNKQN